MKKEAVSLAPNAAQHAHDRSLLQALHKCTPVLHAGRARFIHTLNFQIRAGSTSTTVYLTGDSTPINAQEIELKEPQQ